MQFKMNRGLRFWVSVSIAPIRRFRFFIQRGLGTPIRALRISVQICSQVPAKVPSALLIACIRSLEAKEREPKIKDQKKTEQCDAQSWQNDPLPRQNRKKHLRQKLAAQTNPNFDPVASFQERPKRARQIHTLERVATLFWFRDDGRTLVAICLGTRSRSFLMRHDSVIAWLLDRIRESVRMLHCDLEAPGWGEPFRIVHLWLPDAIERVGRPGGAMKALDGKICGFLAHKLLYGTFVVIVSLFFTLPYQSLRWYNVIISSCIFHLSMNWSADHLPCCFSLCLFVVVVLFAWCFLFVVGFWCLLFFVLHGDSSMDYVSKFSSLLYHIIIMTDVAAALTEKNWGPF